MKKETSSSQPIEEPVPPASSLPSQRNNKLLLIIGIILLLFFFTTGAYYLGMRGVRINLTTGSKEQSLQLTPTSQPLPTSETPQTSLFSGQLKKLSQNLKIFKSTENDSLNGIDNDFGYYEAGKFNKGELKDYTRVIVVRPPEGPGQTLVFVLATKDFQSYILDDPDSKTTKYAIDDYQNPYSFLDKNKILSAKTFETEQPKEINLGKDFALFFQEFPTQYIETNRTDKNGNKIEEVQIISDFSSYSKLTSSNSNFTYYFKPYGLNNTYDNQLSQAEKEKNQLRQKYLLGTTEVIVVDSVGFPMTYSLTTPESIKVYNGKQAKYEVDFKKYQTELKKYENKEIAEYPNYPNYVFLPTLGFASSDILSQKNLNFFKTYETAIPDACASTQNSRIVNVRDDELEQIGTVHNLPLYTLKDANHLLFALAYKTKLDYYDLDPQSWDQVNKGMKKPTLAEYVSKNPLLFIKDYWQRWVAFGEYDIQLPGGCGKPVVYLYSTQPTQVSVKFQVPVQFTTDIPKYADFWSVLAYPDGKLVNLKPEFTDCKKLDFGKNGSEYAKKACLTNTYPYLYWAGNVVTKDYPEISKGWVVEQANLGKFLEDKLTEAGLTANERNDFISFWLPEMLLKNAPYFRVSFLQTNELNSLFPMEVSPNPDTIFRIFLDYSPLLEKPKELPAPQTLNKLVRNGFTLVEWGGRK